MYGSLNRIEQHFRLPEVNRVAISSPFQWLKQGWRDLTRSPAASLGYGAVLALAGYLILNYAADRPYLFTAAVSGFFLLSPLLAAGLYELSRRQERGKPGTLSESFSAWGRNHHAMLYMGIVLVLVAIVWERISAILFALLFPGGIADIGTLGQELLAGEYLGFLAAYLIVGGALAVLTFVLVAVSIPMLIDRDVDVVTAMMASFKAVAYNLRTMGLWAALIVLLVGVGYVTYLIGLIVLLPLLGHATWHAYRDLVR